MNTKRLQLVMTAQKQKLTIVDQNNKKKAQTPQQRRANLKFVKDQEARRGKSEEQIKKRAKDTPKSPISPIWLGKLFTFSPCMGGSQVEVANTRCHV